MVIRVFPRYAPFKSLAELQADGGSPDWLRFIWAVNANARAEGQIEPFSGRPKLSGVSPEWTEEYPTGARVCGTASTVSVSYTA